MIAAMNEDGEWKVVWNNKVYNVVNDEEAETSLSERHLEDVDGETVPMSFNDLATLEKAIYSEAQRLKNEAADTTVRVGPLFINSETGELLMDIDFPPDVVIETKEKVEGYLFKVNQIRGRIAAIAAAKEASDAKYRTETNKLEWQMRYYASINFVTQVKNWFQANLPKKGKSLVLTHGKLSFASAGGNLVIEDEEKALEWAQEHCKEAIKKDLLISKISEKLNKIATAEEKTVLEAITVAGAEEAFSVAPKVEKFGIDVGYGKEKTFV